MRSGFFLMGENFTDDPPPPQNAIFKELIMDRPSQTVQLDLTGKSRGRGWPYSWRSIDNPVSGSDAEHEPPRPTPRVRARPRPTPRAWAPPHPTPRAWARPRLTLSAQTRPYPSHGRGTLRVPQE
jgi:hypothetical protein